MVYDSNRKTVGKMKIKFWFLQGCQMLDLESFDGPDAKGNMIHNSLDQEKGIL
jgi:hypothetical protein